ncbi:MAG TPA: YihY/virulence factor BrkB family protein [Trebonia sp.]|nr:YihY/virulence factor BrkB family protein [Trebonia sp.]
MNALGKTVTTVDRTQQRLPWLAFPIAVWKKFGDDQAGNLAALIAYYGFVATFPLLLVFVTVLNITLKNNPTLQHQLLNSALAQYPVIGDEIKNNLHAPNTSGLPLVIGIVVLLLGARGVANAIQNALCEVWDIPRSDRPGFPWSFLLSMALVFAVGGGLVATTFLSGLAGGIGHVLNGAAAQAGTVAVSLVLNVGVFWLAFRLGTVRRVRWRDLWVGAAIAAFVWQVLQLVSGYVVKHQLSHSSSLYGTFGVVLGLLAWLYLQAEVTLYAAEIDVVLVRRLWPRSIKSDSGNSADSDQKTGTTA